MRRIIVPGHTTTKNLNRKSNGIIHAETADGHKREGRHSQSPHPYICARTHHMCVGMCVFVCL